MSSRLQRLAFGSFAFWAVVALPARHFGGRPAFAYSLVALLLCLAPALAVACWRGRALVRSPEQQLLATLGGTGLRMVTALGGGLALAAVAPAFRHESFWLWLLVFYLVTLFLELSLLVAESRPAAGAGRELESRG